ncbi:polymer-forming cytoskeletal protein, partial [Streptococcus suis]|uniref:polymer-forming cytoskeletal protein n=1 Tax=Streptococcus suis TaxID=1307 RepID=UPI00201A7A31
EVSGDAEVWGDAEVSGNAEVSGDAKVWGDAEVSGNAEVSGDAEVWGDAEVSGNAEVSGDAKVSELGDIIVFKNHWSSGRHFTYTKSNKMWKVGCFYGTGQELIEKAYRDSEKSGNYYKAYVDFVETLERLSEE